MSKLILNYFAFVIACVIVILGFITATNYIQLAVAILLYPVLVFFALKVLPKHKKTFLKTLQAPLAPIEKETTSKRESIGISDIDKRLFLKLIGSAGVFLFLFSIFNKKAEGLFFKSMPGSVSGMVSLQDKAGSKINPAQHHPTDGFRISEIDDSLISFYGFTNSEGAWYVMRVDTETGAFRYAKGEGNFSGGWNNRKNLNYDYFNNTF